MDGSTIVYRIDASDRIVFTNDAWDTFALVNDGARATSPHVLGRSLWAFISDPTTRALYKRVLERIRAGNALRFNFRCDSPACRRTMEMQVSAGDAEGGVEFRSRTVAENHRQSSAVLQWDGAAGDAHEAHVQRVCSWCNRFDVGGVWLEVEDALPQLRLLERAVPSRLTHGICETCFETMAARLG